MITADNIRGAVSEVLSGARQATRTSIINYTERLLDRYSTISKQLTTVKEISSGWLSTLVNRKAMKLLIDKLRKIKRDISAVLKTYSSLKTKLE
jgi:hypothetical protein